MREGKLVDDVVECGSVVRVIDGCIVSIKWRGHIEAIEPHLIGVGGAVPETALGISWVCLELASEEVSC